VFVPQLADGPPAAQELLQLPVEEPPAAALADLTVLVPRLDPEQVRAGAERLAAWPAYQAAARDVWRALESHLQALDPALDRWDAIAAAAVERGAAAAAGLATVRARAAALAGEVLAGLEKEIAPEIDRGWELHVAATKLMGGYYEHRRGEQSTAAGREQERIGARAAAAARELRRQQATLAEIEAELAPLAGRWQELATAHERLGTDLRRAWKHARSQATHSDPGGELFVSPRAGTAEQAATLVPQLAQEVVRLTGQAEDLVKLCAKDEKELPAELPWPAWPARISLPIQVDDDLAALNTLLRRVRNEPVRARARLDTLNSLRAKATHTLERALGAQEALATVLAAAAAGNLAAASGRTVSLKSQADGVVAQLYALVPDLARVQRRLEGATVAYDDVADSIARALKGGRTAPTWEQGRRVQADYTRLQAEHEATGDALAAARAALIAAQTDQETLQAAAARAQEESIQAEQQCLARSEEYATREEGTLRRHIHQIQAQHEAVLATLAARQDGLAALAAFEDRSADHKIRAAAHLSDRIRILAALAAGRIDETAAARATALWPPGSWPATDMLYLLPVWLLRYRPLGRRTAPRLLAVTPGTLRPAAGGRFRLAAGFAIEPQPGLAGRFADAVLSAANRAPGLTTPLAGANLLAAAADRAAPWRALAARGLVPPWITRLF
ncbi:MAG TPA: hypothetical protein VKY74_27235, partial [Chloroflexia bacterium]|nr:hypothetical protein [Chloroflexia bacterium]